MYEKRGFSFAHEEKYHPITVDTPLLRKAKHQIGENSQYMAIQMYLCVLFV